MTGAYEIIALSLICVFLALILKEIGFKGARLLSTVAMVAIIFAATEGIGSLRRLVFDAASVGGVENEAKCILKIIGVGYVYGICADVCREIGENGVANAVQVAGRVEILLISAPFIAEIISLSTGLIS